MAFNYKTAGPTGQTVLTPTSKDTQCRSFRVDFSQTNATTAVAFDIGWLPKDAQVVGGTWSQTAGVTGPSVTAATASFTVNSAAIFSGLNVFATGAQAGPTSSGYYGSGLKPTADQKVQGTLTLTGGATATGGVLYLNIIYVI